MSNLNHSQTLAATLFTAALLLATTATALAEVHYVDVNSTNATPPYTNWTTAAANIQDAIDAAIEPEAQVLVNNGFYDPIYVPGLLRVRSVNGPNSTTIYGYRDEWSGSRCAYLADGASLSGFTLTGGYVDRYSGPVAYGAGVFCESRTAVVSNCVVSYNVVSYDFAGNNYDVGRGGGAYGGTLNNCTLIGNSVEFDRNTPFGSLSSSVAGGGASDCTLNNCTLNGNSAVGYFSQISGRYCGAFPYYYCTITISIGASGGGAYNSTLNNCTLTGNRAWAFAFGTGGGQSSGGAVSGSTLNNCTLTGNSGSGAYNSTLKNCIVLDGASSSAFNNCWTTDPLFVPGGNLRLQSNSPCINAGLNAFAPAGPDLDGNPRISGGVVDIGAYEFQFNNPPVALANVSPLFALLLNETNRLILSPNNADASVVLDGSQSSDADNDQLQFSWYADGQSNALATGAIATNQFTVGPHIVQLVVSDSHDTATAQVSFEVITPATAVGQLMVLVDEANLGSRNKQPLFATLSAAMSSFHRDNLKAALNRLSAFHNKVRAQIAPSNPALANEFTAASQTISEVVNGR